MPREHHFPAITSMPSLARVFPTTHPLYYRTHDKILDGDGNAYYMNAETGESRWDLPVVPAEPDDLAAAGVLVAGEASMEAGAGEDLDDVAESAAEVGGEAGAATGVGAGAEAGGRGTGELQDAAMPPPPPAPTLSQEELDAKIEQEEEMAAMRSMFAIQLAKNATTAAVATTMQRVEDEWRAAEKLRWEEIHKAAHADYRQNAAADDFRPPPGHPKYAEWLERTVAAEDTRQEALAALAAKGGSAAALAAGEVGPLPGPGLLDDMISAVTLEEDHASLDVPAADELAMMIEGLDDSVASRPAARKGGRLDGPDADATPSEAISLVSRKLSSAIARLSETEDAGQAPLRRVDLNSERIADEGAEQLAAALRTSAVRELFLLDNEIGDQGIVCIANALKSNRSLTELYLNGNGIGDEGVRSLCASFADSPLTLLNISSNPISHRGAQFLAEMLVKPTCKVTSFVCTHAPAARPLRCCEYSSPHCATFLVPPLCQLSALYLSGVLEPKTAFKGGAAVAAISTKTDHTAEPPQRKVRSAHQAHGAWTSWPMYPLAPSLFTVRIRV